MSDIVTAEKKQEQPESGKPANQRHSLNRRDFLRLGAAGLALVAAPKILSGSNGSGASAASRESGSHGEERAPHWAMVIDQAKCAGCGHCSLACQATNDSHPDITWNRLNEVESVGGEAIYQPTQCMHCEHAPCVHACPVQATYHRPDGIVMMDYDRCIGCRYCQIACPYGARSFNWEEFSGENPNVPRWGQPEVARRPRGVAEKCSFCYQRIDRGLALGMTPGVDLPATPACVVACPTGARVFGDLNDPESPASQALANHGSYRPREDLGTNPRIYYLPAHDGIELGIEELS